MVAMVKRGVPAAFLVVALVASGGLLACGALFGVDFDDAHPRADSDVEGGVRSVGEDAGGVPRATPDSGSAGVARGTIVLFGGTSTADGHDLLRDTWTFDGTKWMRVAAPTSPLPRFGSRMSALGRNVVLFGGQDAAGPLHDTWIFDGATWRQVPTVHTPDDPLAGGMASLGNKVVFYDGSATWTFDGVDWTRLPISSPSPARSNPTMGTWGDRVVAVGGANTNGPGPFWLGDAWTFDGNVWTKLAAGLDGGTIGGAIGPLQDWLVVTSGCGEGQLDPVTSFFDNSNWISLRFQVQGAAPWGCDHPMFEVGGKLLLFENLTPVDGGLVLDAWAFSKTTRAWSTASFPGAPPGRSAHAMAYVP